MAAGALITTFDTTQFIEGIYGFTKDEGWMYLHDGEDCKAAAYPLASIKSLILVSDFPAHPRQEESGIWHMKVLEVPDGLPAASPQPER